MIDDKNMLSEETYDKYINELKAHDSLFVGKLSKNKSLPRSELLNMMLLYAVKNNKQERIYKLIQDKDFVLNAVIDQVNHKTLLASTIYYPFYTELFKHLIDLGAEIYKNAKLGDPCYRSNVLMLSVNYGEFENVEYLLNKELVSYEEVLVMCLKTNNRVLLKMFLESAPSPVALKFINFNLKSMKSDSSEKIMQNYIESKNK